MHGGAAEHSLLPGRESLAASKRMLLPGMWQGEKLPAPWEAPTQPQGKAGVTLHPVHPYHGNSNLCQSQSQAGCHAMPCHAKLYQ